MVVDMSPVVDSNVSLENRVQVLDLFSGVGGLSFGMCEVSPKFETIGAIDFSEDAVDTFNQNVRGSVAIERDLTDYAPESFVTESGVEPSDIDVLCGGPPCKGFSSIRPNRSDNNRDDRNYLYQFYFNFVEHFSPDVFVMENVPQLLTHTNDTGERIFESVVSRGEELGYDISYQLLNAAHYGVPQLRTRLVVIGVKQSNSADISVQFPQPLYDLDSDSVKVTKQSELLESTSSVTARTIECALKDLPTLEPGEEKSAYFCEPEELVAQTEQSYVEYLRAGDPELTHHKASNNTEMMRKRLSFAGETRDDLPEYIFPSSGYSSTYSRLRRDVPSSTLTTNFTTASSTRCIHPYENRALSLREGARIQSFPDRFTFSGTKGEIRKQIGNAVPPLLGQAIGETVRDIIGQLKH